MAINFSSDQLKAIYDSGSSILVNAGAGSGKTAVLAERLYQKLVKGVHLKDLIVVTFTKLAASEMKERLRNILLKEVKANPSLQSEIDYIDQANIQTFDAFCNEIVKKYHYTIGIEKNFNICDDNLFSVSLNQIINEVLETYYNSNNSDFEALIHIFTVKSDDTLVNNISKMYKKAKSNLMKFNEPQFSFIIDEAYKIIKYKVEKIKAKYDEICAFKCDILSKMFDAMEESINKFDEAKDFDDMRYACQSFSCGVTPRCEFDDKEKFKEKLEELKAEVKNVGKVFDLGDSYIQEHYTSFSKVFKDILEEILIEVDKRFIQYKKDNSMYDFNDIASFAIEIFKNNEDIRLSYVNRINEILIDEYQDTSLIQETLMNLISNNNMYMVGDVKQSIYRFRYADPKIFTNTYERLQNGEGEVIDLNKNFRSSSNVINTVNDIFTLMMTQSVGGVNYNHTQQLNFGFTKYLEGPDTDKLKTEILEYDIEGEIEEEDEDETPKKKSSEFNGFSKGEIEAFAIAKDIISKVDKLKVYDKQIDDFRLAHYKDFCILCASRDKFDVYKKIFDYMGIPINLVKDEKLTQNDTFFALANLIKCICYFDKVNDFNFASSLISILRSYIIRLDDDTIHDIFTLNNAIREKENIKVNLKDKASEVYERLAYLNSLTKSHDVCDIFDKAVNLFDIYENTYMVAKSYQQESIINSFAKLLSDISSLNYTIEEVVNYIDGLISQDSFGARLVEEGLGDSVTMMTIHQSKGLEFPICYFPELYKRFNLRDNNDNFIYSETLGIVCPYAIDEILYESISKYVQKNKFIQEEVSEKIRLFYVALTRAREQIVIVTPKLKKIANSNSLRQTYTSYHKLLSAVYDIVHPYIKKFRISDIGLTKEYLITKSKASYDKMQFASVKLINNNQTLQEIVKAHPSKEMIKIPELTESKNLNQGTHFHRLLEFVDLSNPMKYSQNKLIYDFLNSKLMGEVYKQNIVKWYNEYKFSYLDYSNCQISGIIDLVIETNDSLIVIDYKLSNIDDSNYDKQVKMYIDYLKTISNKTIKGYLYSIASSNHREVN